MYLLRIKPGIGDNMFEVLMDDLDAYAYRLGYNKKVAPLMLFLYPATWSIVVYRFGNWILKKCNILIVKNILFMIYFIFKRLTEILTGIEIAQDAEIGNGLFISHFGVIIGTKSIIGNHSSFHGGVTVGVAGRGKNRGSPQIGNLVYFGAGAKVLGKIEIGSNIVIGANAVVVEDIPDNAVVGGMPAKIINYKGSKEFIHVRKGIMDE